VTAGANALPSERRQLLLIATLAITPFILLAIWARLASPAPWEPGVMIALASQPGILGDISGAINTIGNLPLWAVVVALSAIALGVLRGVWAGVLVALSFCSDLAAFAVKLLVERDRPETAAVEQIFGFDSFSFPSGHTVRASALVAVVIWLLAPAKWRVRLALIGGLIAGTVMGYARVSLGVHWPTDTIGGVLLGLSWSSLTIVIVIFVISPSRSRP